MKKLKTTCLILSIIFFSLSISSLALSFLNKKNLALNELAQPKLALTESYDSKISHINNITSLKHFINVEIKSKNLTGIDIPIFIDDILRKKFFHRTSYVDPYNNWLLNIANWLFPQYYFNTKMDPNDIAKNTHAICNQQAILFQELVKDYGFEFASIGIHSELNHFTSAVKVEGDWYFFDPNMEPKYNRKSPDTFNQLIKGDKETFNTLYPSHKVSKLNASMISFRNVNQFPAKNGLLFQRLTFILSHTSWIPFFIIFLILRNKENELVN